jgi:hypothetical protein
MWMNYWMRYKHATPRRAPYTLTGKADEELVNIMEDITGQWVDKVVKTIRYIKDRILAMLGIWGADAFINLPVKDETPAMKLKQCSTVRHLLAKVCRNRISTPFAIDMYFHSRHGSSRMIYAAKPPETGIRRIK